MSLQELLSALITCCVALADTHTHALVEAIQDAEPTSENKDTVNIEHARGAQQLLELLLAAQAAPGHYPLHETRSNLVFGFWYTLQVINKHYLYAIYSIIICRLLEMCRYKI